MKKTSDNAPPWIRQFELADLKGILEIEQRAFPKTAYSKRMFLEYAKNNPQGFVVLETGEEIAGYILYDPSGHIHSMAVKTAHRRKGLGAMLFAHAAKNTKEGLWLEVRSKNAAAIAFYKSMGMQVRGGISKYYGDDDALIMALALEKP